MPSQFTIDYIIWVFLCTLGVLQMAVAMNELKGLLFVRGAPPRYNASGGLLLVLITTVWYFADERRNYPDTTLGLDANVQARWFAISGAAAVAMTLALASLINHRWGAGSGWNPDSGEAPPEGMGWLRRTTFARAFAARLAYVWSRRKPRTHA